MLNFRLTKYRLEYGTKCRFDYGRVIDARRILRSIQMVVVVLTYIYVMISLKILTIEAWYIDLCDKLHYELGI